MKKYIILSCIILALLIGCQDDLSESPADSQLEIPFIRGEANQRFSLDPTSFEDAEFLNTLPNGLTLNFSSRDDGGFNFSTPDAVDYANYYYYEFGQIDQSQLRNGSGAIDFEGEEIQFDLVTCQDEEIFSRTFIGNRIQRVSEDYIFLTAFAGSASSPNFNTSHYLSIIFPANLEQGVDLIIPSEEYPVANVSFNTQESNYYYFLENAAIRRNGTTIHLFGIFEVRDGNTFELLNHVTISGEFECG